MKRLLILGAVLLPSCAAPIFVAPTPTFISEQVVPNPEGTAHAFRVDIEERERSAPKARYTLTPISLDQDGLIQRQPCSIPTSDDKTPAIELRTKRSVLVRVYRPGFRTIEIQPGQESREWRWVPVALRDQEKAIDALLGVHSDVGGIAWWGSIAVAPHSELAGSSCLTCQSIGDSGLLPGSVSATHREVLLFAAGEYDWLAKNSAPKSPKIDKTRERLADKAGQMRRYADELTTEEFYRRQSESQKHLQFGRPTP